MRKKFEEVRAGRGRKKRRYPRIIESSRLWKRRIVFRRMIFSITTKGFPPRGKRRRGCVYCALEPLLSIIYCAHTILMCVSFERRKRVCNTCVCNGIAGFRSFSPILFFFENANLHFPKVGIFSLTYLQVYRLLVKFR